MSDMQRPEVRAFIGALAADRGVELEPQRRASDGSMIDGPIVLRLPIVKRVITIEPEVFLMATPRLGGDLIAKGVDRAIASMFDQATEFLTQHDAHAFDRLHSVESAARALLARMGDWPTCKEHADLILALKSKPGAVTWRKSASDPKEPT